MLFRSASSTIEAHGLGERPVSTGRCIVIAYFWVTLRGAGKLTHPARQNSCNASRSIVTRSWLYCDLVDGRILTCGATVAGVSRALNLSKRIWPIFFLLSSSRDRRCTSCGEPCQKRMLKVTIGLMLLAKRSLSGNRPMECRLRHELAKRHYCCLRCLD